MKKNNLLSRAEMKNVTGGSYYNCSVNYVTTDNPPQVVASLIHVEGTCAEQKLACQQAASNLIVNDDASSSSYDTQCDGWKN